MRHETYNGWTNYETWSFNLYHDDAFRDQANQVVESAVQEFDTLQEVKEKSADLLADMIMTFAFDCLDDMDENALGGFFMDSLKATLHEVNFQEIASHYTDDLAEELFSKNEVA